MSNHAQNSLDELKQTGGGSNVRHFSIVGVLILIMTGVMYLLLSGDIIGFGFFEIPFAASAEAAIIDALFAGHFWLIAFLFSVIVVPMIYAIVVFRQQEGDETDAPHIHENTVLEIAWTVVPLIFVIGFAVWGFTSYTAVIAEQPSEVLIRTQAVKWDWNFFYPEEGDTTSASLVLRVNQPVKLEMQSLDVIHAFWVPEFRVKQDVVPFDTANPVLSFARPDDYSPSSYNYTPQVMRFTPTVEGVYRIRCAEICGTSHYGMLANVFVLSDANYQAWLDGTYLLPPDPNTGNIQSAEGVIYYLDDLEQNFDINTGYTPPEEDF